MKTIGEATSRQLELEQVRRSITRTNEQVAHFERTIGVLLSKNIRRHREIATQEKLMRAQPPTTP